MRRYGTLEALFGKVDLSFAETVLNESYPAKDSVGKPPRSPPEYSTNSTTDSWIIEFTYGHSTHRIVIALNSMTESAPTTYPTTNILLALLIATLILATVIKKKKPHAYSIRARHGNSQGQTKLFFTR